MLNIHKISTVPFSNQIPGTSGLRRTTKDFMQQNYLQNYIQSVCNALMLSNKSLLLGSDGRFYSPQAIQIIIGILVANNISTIYIPINGIISTPAASNFIIKNNLNLAILATASHNRGGLEFDFGIKINNSAGAPIEDINNAKIVHQTTIIEYFYTTDLQEINLQKPQSIKINNTTIILFDPTELYINTLENIFNFKEIKKLIENKFYFNFNGLNGTTGIFAEKIFANKMQLPHKHLINCIPKPDFGGIAPDPNPTSVAEFIKNTLNSGVNFGAACDSDGDRNFIFTNKYNLTASDQLALLTKYAYTVPYFKNINGVARSFATPPAVDAVAKNLGINTYITPTGWKFFSNLIANNNISLCGEESFGIGGNYIKEKDGLFAILFILHIMATTNLTLNDLLENLWQENGKWFFSRLDFENLTTDEIINNIYKNAKHDGIHIEDFSYTDITNKITTSNCGQVYKIDKNNQFIVRKSGTSTSNTTVRIYLHSYSANYTQSFLHTMKNKINTLINLDIKPSLVI